MVTISSLEGIDIFEDLKTYFSRTEWDQLADAERIRYNNIMKNHLSTTSIDVKSVTPEFMRRDKTSEGVKEEKEDEERTPSLSGGHNETVAVYPGGRKSRIDNTEQIMTADHNYFRKPSRTDTTEQIVPEDHHYCDQCKQFSLEECKVHGPPVFMAHRTMANRTTPSPRSEIRQSGIPDVGLEVVYRAETEISVRTDIGPYEGVKTDREEAIQSGYSWVASEERNNYNYIAKEQTQPYCMSYVNCANNETEQNMMAFQCIGMGELLLVSRGDEYPKDLAIVFDAPWDNNSSAEGVGSQSSPTQVFSCSECQYSFNTQVYLHKHMKSRHNDLYCQMLKNGQIPSAQQITRHKQGSPCLWLVTDEPSHQLFTKALTQSEVKTHGLTYTENKTFLCKQCDRGFCQLGDLNRHQRIHTGEKPYQCTQCGKTFSQLSNLRRHEDLHTGERRFHCKQCGRTFNLQGHLKTHLRIHTGEKPYRCKHCHKSFSQSGDLKKHQRGHTGEKPFHCKQCNKCFNRLDTLKTHQRIHTGEKPFPCKHCDKSFSQLANLKSHERLHTGEKPFHCKLCDRSFSQLGVLNRHQRRERAREMG